MKLIKEFKNFNPHPEKQFPYLDDDKSNDELDREEMEEPLEVISGFEDDEVEDMSDDELERMYAALEKDVEMKSESFIKTFEGFEYDEFERYFYLVEDILLLEEVTAGSIDNPNSKAGKMIKKKSKQSGIPVGVLKKVYKRGSAAWNSGHRPGTPQQAWATGRVNSFITGAGGARKADADLWTKAKAAKARKKKK
jgi:hypothetical protein